MKTLLTLFLVLSALGAANAQSAKKAMKMIDKAIKKFDGIEITSIYVTIKNASYENGILQYDWLSRTGGDYHQKYENIKWSAATEIRSYRVPSTSSKTSISLDLTFPHGIVKGAAFYRKDDDDGWGGGDDMDHMSLYFFEEDEQDVMKAIEILKKAENTNLN